MAGGSYRKLVWILLFLGLAAAAAALIASRSYIPMQPQGQVPPGPSPAGIACLGRIQPEDGTVTIGARSVSGQPSLIGQLRVKEAEDVKEGQIIAILNSAPQLEAAWRQAEARVKVAELRRDQAKAGAKASDIQAQQAEINRLELELANSRTEFNRIDNLFKQGIVSQSVLDQSRFPLDTKSQLIAQAKERLRSLTEVRQVDVDVADAELQSAVTDASLAKIEAENAIVRSPYNGRVLKIHAWEGQEVGSKGILELARVDRMYVVAEVAESDIGRVKIGQRAKITGDSLSQTLNGVVERLGLRVSGNSMTQHDPVSITDARVVEVKILLDDATAVRDLIDGVVEVLILSK